ncbi:unnamed protein product [Notodromas monacha]|uniref:Uncharacterized protein n=1 Tax=Notodromas monacha TaxID=399045 RepID=A0A7R9BPQ4_9CRUS|nr:unnamed protein product [Notodromas monacha]CAG0919362.1 unnamed protein product [Notodromas monacha]
MLLNSVANSKYNVRRRMFSCLPGVSTCACVEPCQQWMAIGTSGGVITCYDLRFSLPAGTIQHPGKSRVRKLLAYPVDRLSGYPSGSVIASFKGNNEVAVWNFETQSRQMTLWASPTPPMSTTQMTQYSVCAICMSPTRDGLSWLLGSSDMRLRLWNTEFSSKSRMVSVAGNDAVSPSSFHYSVASRSSKSIPPFSSTAAKVAANVVAVKAAV